MDCFSLDMQLHYMLGLGYVNALRYSTYALVYKVVLCFFTCANLKE